MEHISHSQKGISLIEVLISLGMLAVLLILYVAALNVVAITKKLRFENLAYHVASTQVEELRSIPVESLPPSGTITDALLAQIPQGAGSFTVVDSGSFTGLKEISVTVTWNDGIAKQLELETLAGAGGINP
ncbi:MAG: prepilin-type N-terminal cleavage/methylation domain-containing protein [Candidatus Doudnabacteria bacterium]|nr:prepilin-type N-terminal cleavage/methylation domain-containing protein [Candidatus Doudnabacteria bacterium]